jgi:hypothetical protein
VGIRGGAQRVIAEAGDVTAGAVTIGVVAELVPIVLGLLAAGWYLLRFINWYRVNYKGKDPWELR